MTGEIEFDNLIFPVREEVIQRNQPDSISDIASFSKAQYFPITAHIIAFFGITLVSIVIFNLILGIAVSDVQVIETLLKKIYIRVVFIFLYLMCVKALLFLRNIHYFFRGSIN